MNNPDGSSRPRLRIVDTTGSDYRPVDNKKRRKQYPYSQQRRTNPFEEQERELADVPQWPLESMSILRSVKEYGRRTSALGAQQGAAMLRMISQRLRESGVNSPIIEKIAFDADADAEKLRSLLDKVYEDE